MVAYNKFEQTVEDWLEGVYIMSTNTFVVALTVASPSASLDLILGDITEINYANLSSRTLSNTSTGQTSGTFTHLFTDLTLTASGGAVAAFQYLTLYNDTPVSPVDPLLGWYNFGSSLTLQDGDSLLMDWTTSTFTLDV